MNNLMAGKHYCPGQCGERVPNKFFACRSCWGRLPRHLQRPILSTTQLKLHNPIRTAALLNAKRYYTEQENADGNRGESIRSDRSPETGMAGQRAAGVGETVPVQ